MIGNVQHLVRADGIQHTPSSISVVRTYYFVYFQFWSNGMSIRMPTRWDLCVKLFHYVTDERVDPNPTWPQ